MRQLHSVVAAFVFAVYIKGYTRFSTYILIKIQPVANGLGVK
jgi:hypothetical protein